VRRFTDAFNRRDAESMADYYDPDVEVHEWPTAPGASVFRGLDGARSAIEGWFDVWEWMKVEIVDFVDAGDRVLVTLDQRAKGKESEVEWRSGPTTSTRSATGRCFASSSSPSASPRSRQRD
jgi:ketosteroid isomerase-like protein